MKHTLFSFALICSFMTTSATFAFKILHLSLHKGCINDFHEVAEQLNLDVTDWYIHEIRSTFDPAAQGNEIYNITHERAERVWQLNKDFFNQFDAIITSDTAPLSRIFLQNDWQKPLIIWICNRFDYADLATARGLFPDTEYYQLFKSAIHRPNVQIISYTPYEHFYAHQKGIKIGTQTIRPIGVLPKENCTFKSGIPESICKEKTIFIVPRMTAYKADFIQKKCKELGIHTYYGTYNGPDDLTDFKGVLYYPYAWSNLALFENIQRGIVHFVPTPRFVLELRNKNGIPCFTTSNFYLCDWYCDEYKDLFVYFDSWQELKEKIANTDYAAMHEKIKKAGFEHWQKNLNAWKDVFNLLGAFKDS